MRFTLSLIAAFAAALAARFWGLGFGLPQTECRPDESWILAIAADFWTGDLNPRFFQYPSLYLYMVSGAFGVDYAAGRVLDGYRSFQHFQNQMILDRAHLHLVGRIVTALFGAATVIPLARLGATLFDRPTALLAAAGLAVTHLHVRESHFATTDVPMAFFITWALARLARIDPGAAWPVHARAGLVAGLATSTKYAGALLALPAAVVSLGSREPLPRRARALAAFLAALVAVFFATTPFALPEWPRFVSDVMHQSAHLEEGHRGLRVSGWRHHLGFSLWYGLGLPQIVAAAAGAALLLVHDRRKAAFLLSFPLAYFLLVARGQTAFVRYALPLVPVACLLAAAATRILARRLAPSRPEVAAVALHALVLLPSAIAVVQLDRLLSRTDTRLLAAAWIEEHVASGAGIYQTGSRWSQVQLPPSWEVLSRRYGPGEHPSKRLYKIELQNGARGFDEWRLGDAGFLVNGRPTEAVPEYVVVQESALTAYDSVPPAITARLQTDYERVAEWRALDPRRGAEARFDPQDAFYVPYAGFGGALRPGPDIFVYRRRGAGGVSP